MCKEAGTGEGRAKKEMQDILEGPLNDTQTKTILSLDDAVLKLVLCLLARDKLYLATSHMDGNTIHGISCIDYTDRTDR